MTLDPDVIDGPVIRADLRRTLDRPSRQSTIPRHDLPCLWKPTE